MKSVEQIKREYDLFDVKVDFDFSSEDVLAGIKKSISSLDRNKRNVVKTIIFNKCNKALNKLVNIFDSLDEYDMDNNILSEEIDLGVIYKYYLNTLAEIVNNDNCKDIYKLLNFTINNYNDNLAYIEEKRDILEYQQKGIAYMGNGNFTDSIISFLEFFKEITSTENLDKDNIIIKKYQLKK